MRFRRQGGGSRGDPFGARDLRTEPLREQPGVAGLDRRRLSSPDVDPVTELRRLLDESSDADNPGAEELRRLFGRVERIAVVGLSRFPEKAARRVPSYLAAKGYDVIPVNPNADRIFGKPAYDRLADVPGEVDMVVVFRPSDEAGAIVREAAARPERPAIWLQKGIRADADIAEARTNGLTAVQDLCSYEVHRAIHA